MRFGVALAGWDLMKPIIFALPSHYLVQNTKFDDVRSNALKDFQRTLIRW
jgi:hypothetical protein